MIVPALTPSRLRAESARERIRAIPLVEEELRRSDRFFPLEGEHGADWNSPGVTK
jgi:hypothetical protein